LFVRFRCQPDLAVKLIDSSAFMCGKLITLVICALLLSATSLVAQLVAQTQPGSPVHSQVVLLGTGDPAADPDQSGPATAIVVNGQAYLVDLGAGVVRRAKAAVVERGIKALEPTNLRIAFITHLHSDHTVGYPDLILTPWVLGRRVPIEVYGPTGTNAMTEHLLEAYRLDFETRTNAVTGSGGQIPEGHVVHAHEIRAGIVYKDENVTVTAFPTKHAMESYGYRFDTGDRSIVISGDTNPTQATINACHGCDILIHEVRSLSGLAKRPPAFQRFASKYHTTTAQLAELASQANPRLLILYHHGIALRPEMNPNATSPAELLQEISTRYSGHVVIGRDLDVY
jgi:ribonuclease BN (tRNA processing enzyme)